MRISKCLCTKLYRFLDTIYFIKKEEKYFTNSSEIEAPVECHDSVESILLGRTKTLW